MNDLSQRNLLSAASHGAIFLSSTIVAIAIPIAILLTSNDPVVKDNAKESLNFHINLYIYASLIFLVMVMSFVNPLLLQFVRIGVPLLVLLGIASVVMPIIAIVNVLNKPERPYRYPFLFRLL
ncbi:DUF4870 domain-containing protein [Oculatella sp. LEGE 06141]|uniref:DUF4870 domain-containing protein n=1 Tax=Oculatella sp. LEGE 06141 TaxID=1828648 RepID=UPI00187F1DCA|nr:DUF4870 domain-containing protein [Oculatella sp. LEGE 06141]MBE9182800.1 DUF4870 domain-containing protein [Oculatella sp. LEGE 06141]